MDMELPLKLSTYEKIQEAVLMIQNQTSHRPLIGLTLGSGLGGIADQLDDYYAIPYHKIPHFHQTAVEGHKGQLVFGRMKQVPVVLLQGRFHFYEGYSMEEVVFPTRTISFLGIKALILTNAAGGINTRFRPGDLMLIEDHLNLMTDSPLRGPNLAQLGPRFPDLSQAYDPKIFQMIQSIGSKLSITNFHTGVYAGLPGPSYETPAEVRMLRILGADAVGMSTVPESIAANHLGIPVAAISCITNLAAGMSSQKLTHEEVMETSKMGAEKIENLLGEVIPELAMMVGAKNEI